MEAFATVLVVAPERQRSAASHASRCTAAPAHRGAPAGSRCRARRSTACTSASSRVRSRPSAVVSGVKRRAQPRQRRLLLGTVAAAVEGALRGAAGMAFSLAPRAPQPDAAMVSPRLVRTAIAEPMPPGTVLNVNHAGQTAPTRTSAQARRRLYSDAVSERKDPRCRPYYWVRRRRVGPDYVDGTDSVAIARGWNSITPMHPISPTTAGSRARRGRSKGFAW